MICFVYILQVADKSFYCGITNNIDRRIKEHKRKGKGYVQRKGFKELVWLNQFETRTQARRVEVLIKKRGVKKYFINQMFNN